MKKMITGSLQDREEWKIETNQGHSIENVF